MNYSSQIICLTVLLSISSAVFAEKPDPESSAGAYRFVGFSDEMMNGGGGFLKRYQACQATYGNEARMCTSKEIMETVNLPDNLVGYGWVQPVFVQTIPTYVTDISGATQTSPGYLTCQSWINYSSGFGLVMTSNVAFGNYPCTIECYVSCCVPE